MDSLAAQPAAAYDDRDYLFAHLVLAGVVDGTWSWLEARTAAGLAALAAGAQPDPADLKTALVTFRKARGLISGEDFRAWREARGLTADDLTAYLERELAADAATESGDAPDVGELSAVMRAQAICSGTLARLTDTLMRWAAARRALLQQQHDWPARTEPEAILGAARACIATGLDGMAPGDLEEAAREVAELHDAYDEFERVAADAEKIARAIAGHGLAWQRFRWSEVAFNSESAAREAVLLVREDGLELGDVAQMAGTPASDHQAYFDELGKDVSGVLVSTPPGDLAGPLPHNGAGSWRVLRVDERTLADSADPVLRERAAGELISDALERHLVGRVKVYGEL